VKVQKKKQEYPHKPSVRKNILEKTGSAPGKNKIILWLAIILITSFIAYSPALRNGITNWDDDQYILKNPWLQELSAENIKSIFTEYYMGNYHPLAMLSLSIDFQIGGLDEKGEIKPFIYHFTNIALHLINTILVFLLVYLLFARFEIAVISSLLFGLSTLHVESVAWISERKDVLYALFFIASLCAYTLYVKRNKSKYYVYSLIFFILSLFSKGQAVSLAITLFAIDFLFERKLLEKRVLLEKIPFLLLALIFGLVAIKAQQAGNAMHDTDSYEFYKRIGFAGYAFTQYLVKLLIPLNLSAIYPYPDIINKSIPAHYWLFLIPSLLTAYAFFYFLKRNRIISFCIAFFTINIFLLLQLIPVGSAIWADRYSYIPSIGYYALLGWLLFELSMKFRNNRLLIYSFTGVYLIVIGIASFNRTQVWETSLRLWDDTLEKSPKAVVAWNNRGSIKDKAKKHQEAIDDFSEAIRLKPDYTHAFYNRGTARRNRATELKDSSLFKEAIADFDFAIKLNHAFVEALHNRGMTKDNLADFARTNEERNKLLLSALEDHDKTVELKPDYENALLNRGVIKGKLGRFDEAIADFDRAIKMAPDSAQGYANRGLAKDFKKDYASAIADFNKAIELKPDFDKAYYNRGLTYRKLNDLNTSNRDFTDAIKYAPEMSDAYYYRGLNYLALKQKDLACRDFESAARLGNIFAQSQFEMNCNRQ
jgi:protein O-mannosyl-transferase